MTYAAHAPSKKKIVIALAKTPSGRVITEEEEIPVPGEVIFTEDDGDHRSSSKTERRIILSSECVLLDDAIVLFADYNH